MKINNTWTEIPVNHTLILNSRMVNLFEHNDKEYYLVLVTEPNHWELWRRDNNGKANVASPVKIFSNDSYEEAKDWSNNYLIQRIEWAATTVSWVYQLKENHHAQHKVEV